MNIVMPADTFLVINRTVMRDDDRLILTMLYEPIIGSMAVGLYFTLWNYLDRKDIISSSLTHHYLMKSTHLSMEKIMEAKEVLEAIGLIKTYVKETDDINDYVYELYSPLEAYDFFKDPIMATLLRDALGINEYKRIVEYFKIPTIDLKGYKNISNSFNNVFKTVSVMDLADVDNIKRENRLGIAYEPTIDLDNIISLIPSQMLNIRSVNSKVKDLIYKLALVYNYDDSKMKDIIMSSIDDAHKIDINLLKENARKLYRFETNNSKISLIYKNQPEYLKTKLTNVSSKNKMIYRFETESPYDYLASKNGCELSREETDILKMLLIDIGLNPGVTNVLLDYVLSTSENKLVKSFIENKALEWKRSNINNVPDAMEKAKEERKKKTKTTKTTTKEPSWFDKDIETDELTEEEEKAFRERLKAM